MITQDTPLRILRTLRGAEPTSIARFTTGNQHHVHDCLMPDGERLVLRIARPEKAGAMRRAAAISDMLRPKGVPLPRILARGLDEPTPWLALERLPGTDLGHVVGSLSDDEIARVARAVERSHRLADALPEGTFYGYEEPEPAETSWADVVTHRRRAPPAPLAGLHRRLVALEESLSGDLSRVRPRPFLHDTTTKNVIVDGGTVSGIVDVDSLCYGDRRWTLALTVAGLVAEGSSPRYADAWASLQGAPTDPAMALYVACHCLSIASEAPVAANGNPGLSDERRDDLVAACAAFVSVGEDGGRGWSFEAALPSAARAGDRP